MSGEIVEYRGVENLVYAEVLKDDASEYKTGEVKKLAGVAELSRTTENGSETHYYDNAPAIVIDSTGADTVTCSVSAIPMQVLAEVTGQMWDEELGVFVEGQRESKYFALGYKTQTTDNADVYVWRHKGKFSIPDSTHATKTNGTEANGQEIVFTGIATTHQFKKIGKVAKAINVNTKSSKADVVDFFTTVQTIDTLVAVMSADVLTLIPSTTDLLGKSSSEMIEKDVRVLADGSVMGTLKKVENYTGFSSKKEEQSGNYFPFHLTQTGTTMSIKGGTTPKENIPFDSDIVLRVDSTKVFNIEVDGKLVVTLKFDKATLEV